MLSVALVGIVLVQDSVTFRFQPKVGEKYRYAATMVDGEGHSMIPASLKAFTIFKIAGQKEDKFTIHEMSDSGVGEPRLIASFRADSLLKSEVIGTDQPTDEGAAGATMAGQVLGVLGLQFSSTPVKVGDSWKPAIDAKAIGKAFVEGTTHDSAAKVEAEGSMTITLQKLEEKTGTFQSIMHLQIATVVEENGLMHHLGLTMDCDQTTMLDRTTGIPSKIERKIIMSMKIDSDTTVSTKVLSLIRV